jgi:peptidoglycan-N-acetylglucosamine deacetylase
MPNKICFVSIDVENDKRESGKFRGVEEMGKILDIFGKYGIRATFFVTGQVLERYGSRVKSWAEDYEISCHAFTHRFWNTLNKEERGKELSDFIRLYYDIFNRNPIGFRAPSHIIDQDGIELLEKSGFLYDSSIVPHYPPFKKYRGYKGRFPLLPRKMPALKILEIPVRGQVFGIPVAGAWIAKIPFWFYYLLFEIYCPDFITLSLHSWDSLDGKCLNNLDKILNLLKNKKYRFSNGEQVYQNYK